MMLDPRAVAREAIHEDCGNGLASCIRTIALAHPDNRLAVFQNMAREAAGYVRKGGIDVSEFADRFQDSAVAYGLVEAHGQDAIQIMLADALKEPPALNGHAFAAHHRSAWSDGPRPEKGREPKSTLVSRCAAGIGPEKIEWLWSGRLARGKHTCIAGEPGTGKSQVCISIIAAITTGGKWPCEEGHAPLGNVIILSAEDGAADTIVPRLLAQSDLELLEQKIATIGDVFLINIDPVSSYLGKTDSHKNAEVRGVLEPIGEMADRTRVAILSVTHFSKTGANNTTKALHRFIGSIAFTGAPRAAFAVIEDGEHEDRRLFLHAKNNLARAPQGLAFRLEQCLVSEGIGASRIVWDTEPVAITANEALAAETAGAETRKRDGFGPGSKSLWSLPEGP
jgi:hypothetical protein